MASNTKPKVREPKTVLDILGISDYQNDRFVRLDGTFVNLWQLGGRSLYNASDSEIEAQIFQNANYYRRQRGGIKLISLNFPTNTRRQQQFLQDKLQNPALSARYAEQLQDAIDTLVYLEQERTDREVYLMLFAENETSYDEQVRNLYASGWRVREIELEKKQQILHKLCNLPDAIKI